MFYPPDPLWDEMQSLREIFFSQFSEEEMDREMSEEEEAEFMSNMHLWFIAHASEELKLYWEYRNWIGDEGQLCDGKGNSLLTDQNNCWSWIQEWDVDEEDYCLYKDTKTRIVNTDGTFIKNPVLDERVEKLYEID